MSYLNWSLLTGVLASGIVAAVLYVKLKLAEERLDNTRAELEDALQRKAELAASLVQCRAALQGAQKAGIKLYETLQTSLSRTTIDGSLHGMREIFGAKDSGVTANPVPPAGQAKPKG